MFMKLKANIFLTVVSQLQAHISESLRKKCLKRWLGFSWDLGCVSSRQGKEQNRAGTMYMALLHPLATCTHLQPDAGTVKRTGWCGKRPVPIPSLVTYGLPDLGEQFNFSEFQLPSMKDEDKIPFACGCCESLTT